MANKNTALIIGSGEVYFNPYDPDTLVGEGEIYLGNTPDFSENRALTTQDVVTSHDGRLYDLEGAPLKEVLTINFTTDNSEIDNIGLWFGALADKKKFTDSVTQTETIQVVRGRHYQLGVSNAMPAGVRGLSGVVATIGGDVVDDDDLSMIIDYDAGRLQIVENAAWFFDGDLVEVTYTYAPQNQATATPASREILGSLRFRATNNFGPLQDYYYPLVRLSPAGDTALKGDTWRVHAFLAEARQLDPYTALVYVTQTDVNPVIPVPTLEPEVQAWYDAQTTKDHRGYVVHVNALIRSGKNKGWYTALDGEFWLFGSKLESSSKRGFKGVRAAADMLTVNGGLTFEADQGVLGDPLRLGYMNTQLRVDQYPGFTLQAHSLYIYVTSNETGAWQEVGAVGTAGAKSVMLRASSGFRGGLWSAANQVVFGGKEAVGFAGFSRVGEFSGFGIREGGSVFPWSLFAESLPTSPFTICSAEPSSANSPNRLLMVAIGAALTQQQALDFHDDMKVFVQDIGLYDEIQVPVEVAGPSCFGKETYTQLIPAEFRVIQQAPFPTTPAIDSGNYIFFPITDAISRSSNQYNTSLVLATDPLSFTTGSKVVTVTDPGRFDASGATRISPLPAVGDVVRIRIPDGEIIPPAIAPVSTHFRGIPYAEIGRWHIIDSIISDTQYTVTVDTTNATTTGTAGNVGTVVNTIVQLNPTSTFVVPRNGVFWAWQWSNRGERDGDDPTTPLPPGAVTRGNDCYPTFNRETDIFTGVQCRPCYKLKKQAVGAMLCVTAYQCGYLPYADPDDPRGWGYMDYAIQYGLDPAKVLLWNYFARNRETVFTIALDGFAVCYDYVILPMKRQCDNTSFPRLGIVQDQEHADSRDPDLWERDLGRWFEITHAKGLQNLILGHYMEGATAGVQGYTPGPDGNAPRLLQHPDCDLWGLIAVSAASNRGKDPVEYVETQWIYMKDGDGFVPPERIVTSCTLGIGATHVGEPVGASQMPLEDCTRIRAWMDGHGITAGHVRRAASNQGSSIDKYWNQQQLRYFPNITEVVAIDSAGVVNAWASSLAADGYALSPEWEAALKAFVTTLNATGVLIWDKLGLVQIHGGENIGQALKCMRRLKNGTLQGSPLPIFTAGRGLTFDGTQNYAASGYIPSDADSGMFGDNGLIGVYERTNVSSDGIAAGGFNDLTVKGVFINPRNAVGSIRGMVNSAPGVIAGVADSLGLSIVQRTSAGVYTFYKRGSSLGTFAPGTHGAVLATREIYIGASNGNGTANNFRASELFATIAGEALTATEHTKLEGAVTALATAIGANV